MDIPPACDIQVQNMSVCNFEVLCHKKARHSCTEFFFPIKIHVCKNTFQPTYCGFSLMIYNYTQRAKSIRWTHVRNDTKSEALFSSLSSSSSSSLKSL